MKKGQAQIFVVVIIILLVLAAFIILYNVVNITVENSSDEITIDPFSTKLKIVQADLDESATFLMVRTDDGSQNYDSFKFIFYDVNGNTHIVDRSEGIPENDLDVGIFGFTHFEINRVDKIKRVSVFPLFKEIPGFEFDDDDFEDNGIPGNFNELQERYCNRRDECLNINPFSNPPPKNKLEQFKCDFYTDLCFNPTCGNGICESQLGENLYNCNIDCFLFDCGDGFCDAIVGEDSIICPIDCP